MDLVSALATKQQEAGGFGEELHRPHPCKAWLNLQKFLCTTRTFIAYIQVCRLPTKPKAHGQGKAVPTPKYIQEVTAHVAPLYATWDVTCNRCNLKPCNRCNLKIWEQKARDSIWPLDFKLSFHFMVFHLLLRRCTGAPGQLAAASRKNNGGWEEIGSKVKNRKAGFFYVFLTFLGLDLDVR